MIVERCAQLEWLNLAPKRGGRPTEAYAKRNELCVSEIEQHAVYENEHPPQRYSSVDAFRLYPIETRGRQPT